jgi:transcription initiation factor IIE alpha subunit
MRAPSESANVDELLQLLRQKGLVTNENARNDSTGIHRYCRNRMTWRQQFRAILHSLLRRAEEEPY